jgi:hypothetical protein
LICSTLVVFGFESLIWHCNYPCQLDCLHKSPVHNSYECLLLAAYGSACASCSFLYALCAAAGQEGDPS